MIRGRLALVPFALSSIVIVASQGDDLPRQDATPRKFLERRLPDAVKAANANPDALPGKTYPRLRLNLGELKLQRFGPLWPEDAVDLQMWKESPGVGDLPLRWDTERKRYALVKAKAQRRVPTRSCGLPGGICDPTTHSTQN